VTRIKIEIGGMSCMHCVHAVRNALGNLDGVTVADVSIGRAVVDVSDMGTWERIQAAIVDEGYEVLGHTAQSSAAD